MSFVSVIKFRKLVLKRRGKQKIKKAIKKRRKEEEIQSKRQQRVAIGDLGPLLDIRTVAN
jgi:hypothetical protein